MPAASRRTRSGRAAPSAPTKRIRTKGGCLTCRIRRKKCDESREHAHGGCETCARLHIECLGYATKRPEWLKGSQVDDYKRKIKHFLADHNAKSTSRGQDEAFLTLHDLRESQLPPRQHSESAHSDSDSDSVSGSSSTEDVKQPQLTSLYVPELTTEFTGWWPSQDHTPVDSYWLQTPMYGTYDGYGSEDAEGSPVSEVLSLSLPGTGFVDTSLLPDLMQDPIQSYAHLALPEPGEQDAFLLTLGSYEYPSVGRGDSSRQEALWASNFLSIRSAHFEPQVLATAANYDLEALTVVYNALCTPADQRNRHGAMRHLLTSNYPRSDARAVTSLWMMNGSLSRGVFDCWRECLDLILLGYVGDCLRTHVPGLSTLSSLDATERSVLRHGLWADLVASATTRSRPPCHIDLYRKVLPSADTDVLGFPNKVALAFAEVAALAALATGSEHIPQAQRNLDKCRADLGVHSELSEAAIHTAGVRLYLETVAGRGQINPAVQSAAQTLCQLVSAISGPRRGFAFWVFLAGCHTEQLERWAVCRTLMDSIKDEGLEEDGAVKIASDIMDDAHLARKQGGQSPNFWAEVMRKRSVLLL